METFMLYEQAAELDRQAKMHLEEELTSSIEEKEQRIQVLQTQVLIGVVVLASFADFHFEIMVESKSMVFFNTSCKIIIISLITE